MIFQSFRSGSTLVANICYVARIKQSKLSLFFTQVSWRPIDGESKQQKFLQDNKDAKAHQNLCCLHAQWCPNSLKTVWKLQQQKSWLRLHCTFLLHRCEGLVKTDSVGHHSWIYFYLIIRKLTIFSVIEVNIHSLLFDILPGRGYLFQWSGSTLLATVRDILHLIRSTWPNRCRPRRDCENPLTIRHWHHSEDISERVYCVRGHNTPGDNTIYLTYMI